MPAHDKFWPKRLPRTLTPLATGLAENLRVSARRYPNKVANWFFGRVQTYAELADQAARLAAALQSMGVNKGDRVLVDMQNSPQYVVCNYAILHAGAVVVPVNPMNRAEELKHYITDPEARVAFTTADLAAELAAASNALAPGQRLAHLIVTHLRDAFDYDSVPDELMPASWRPWLGQRHAPPVLDGGQVHAWTDLLAPGRHAPAPLVDVAPHDLAILPYTSGTTGLPKGCMHTHASVGFNTMAAALWGGATAEGVGLGVVPMFHITGMVALMHSTVYLGATQYILPRWDRDLAGHLLTHHGITQWTNIPTMVIDLLASPRIAEFDLSGLTYIGGGGAAMPQAVAQRLFAQYGLRYLEGYGLPETAAPSHNNPPDHPKQQCLGIPYLGVDSRVVDPETLRELPQGESGEILIRGPQVFAGYWKRPEATAAAFVELDGLRFFRSGDMGRVDEDGYFFMTDRLKRMINASGFKVWPAEVEALMYRHPAIQEACVIASRDPYRGETVKAVVVLRPTHRGQVSEQDIMAWCHDHMAVYKAPRLVTFAEQLPKSGSGKVMWRLLQEAEEAPRGAGF